MSFCLNVQVQRIDQLIGWYHLKNRTEKLGGCLLWDSEDSGFGEGWVTAVPIPALGHWLALDLLVAAISGLGKLL